MNYELLSVVIQSAKDIVAGKGTDEDESDIQEWGAEAIVMLDKDYGDAVEHLRRLVELFPEGDKGLMGWKVAQDAQKYLQSLEE